MEEDKGTRLLGFHMLYGTNKHNKVVISKALENYVTEFVNSLCTDLTRQGDGVVLLSLIVISRPVFK